MTRRLWWLSLRDALTSLLVVAVVLFFVVLAAVTARPEAAVWERVEELPGLGWPVERLRERYLPPDRPPRAAAERTRDAEPAPVDRPVATTAAMDLEFVGTGARLLAEPRASAELVRITDSLRRYEVLERRDSWALLLLGRTDDEVESAWVDLEAERDMSEPPRGNAPEPPRPRPAAAATREQIDAVMAHLEQPIEQSSAAGYSLLLGLRDPVLTGALRAELLEIESAYSARYRLEPLGDAAETVVVFRDEENYRAFQETAPALAGLRSAGHSIRGLVALYKGDRSLGDVRETLRHEVAHLLNRRSLGPALPPWLGEGIADDLALLSKLEGDDPFALYRFTLGNETLYRGPLASLRLLQQTMDAGGWVPLHRMLGMDWEQFVRGGRAPLLYAQSSFLVHWLLESRPDAFRRYLNGVSLGRPASAAELSRACGVEIQELDAEFRAWLDGWSDAGRPPA